MQKKYSLFEHKIVRKHGSTSLKVCQLHFPHTAATRKLTYLLTYLPTYLLTCVVKGSESFRRN